MRDSLKIGSDPDTERASDVPAGPTIADLRRLVDEGIRGNPHLTSRLERAAFLVLLRRIEPVAQDRYVVGTDDGLGSYEVLNGHCQCHDYVRHGAGHPCKHRLALSMYLELHGSDPAYPQGGTEVVTA